MTVSSGFAFDYTVSACGDLSSYQYRFVAPAATAKRVQLGSGASAPAPLGVLQDDPVSGEDGTVRVLGTTKLYVDAGTAIAYGDWLTAGSDGQGVVSTGSVFAAMAMEAVSSGSGVLIEAMLFPFGGFIADNTP